MNLGDEFFLIKTFPDFYESCFDITEYNKIFEKKNVIIHASSKDVTYPVHWGSLSVKCAVKGVEHYQCNNRFYSVDDDCYLIFNYGQYYSSYIYSDTETESFTINFSKQFQQYVIQSFINNLDDDKAENKNFEFIEKLYEYDERISVPLMHLYRATQSKNPDVHFITEIYYRLLENLMLQQCDLKKEILKINAIKYSTQLELYKRLNYAKDFIRSCYMNDLSLNQLASVACLNKAYFLREFKKYFGVTPYQYIIIQRLQAAKKMLETTSQHIGDICSSVGYQDASSFSKLFKKNIILHLSNINRYIKKVIFRLLEKFYPEYFGQIFILSLHYQTKDETNFSYYSYNLLFFECGEPVFFK